LLNRDIFKYAQAVTHSTSAEAERISYKSTVHMFNVQKYMYFQQWACPKVPIFM